MTHASAKPWSAKPEERTPICSRERRHSLFFCRQKEGNFYAVPYLHLAAGSGAAPGRQMYVRSHGPTKMPAEWEEVLLCAFFSVLSLALRRGRDDPLSE